MIKNTYRYNNLEEVPVWLKSHRLVLNIYDITSKFPKPETFGLTSQLRRSSASIPANIAAGLYRNSTKELIQFLYQARGSLGETLYHLRLAKDLTFVELNKPVLLTKSYEDVGKQLNAWIKSLKNINK